MNTSENSGNKVVTRFAPSPTGYMHVGGVRTALYAWAYAKKHNGTFILRIEDTDTERKVEGSVEQIIASLKWLNINWQEGPDVGGPHGPYFQSERLESYKKYAQDLVAKGLAYADPYTTEELDAFRKKAEEEKRPFLYRNHRPENPPVWDGTQPLRLKITNIKSYEWTDLVRGKLSAGPEALDDFILIKSDGYPTYNFAHIIDDLEMGVTHILRADEFISSTPKFLALYEALGITPPAFATLPPIMAPDGKKKLGKRDGAKDILGYKDDGYLPDAMINFLAYIGWNPGTDVEILSPDQFVDMFTLDHIHSSGGNFNLEKLNWTNKEHLRLLSDADFKAGILPFFPEQYTTMSNFNERIDTILPLLRDRISYYGELQTMESDGDLSYFFTQPTYDADLLLCPEKLGKGKVVSLEHLQTILKKTSDILQTIDSAMWNKEYIKDTLWPYADEEGRGIVLWSLRVALSGKEKSPDPFALAHIVGKAETTERIAYAIQLINDKK